MKINSKIVSDIKSYSIKNLDEEVCGFVVKKENDLMFMPIENKHPDKANFFLISPKDYLNIKTNYKILYFFHSHLNNESFSKLDILYQKYHNIDMLLYNIATDELKEMKCKL